MKKNNQKPVTLDTLYIALSKILVNDYSYDGEASALASMAWDDLSGIVSAQDIQDVVASLCEEYKVSSPGTYAMQDQISEAIDEIFDEINPCEDASGM